MSLKGKKILITAGPTWEALDDVRLISNIATGQTGMFIAQEAKRQGAHVTLLLGPTEIPFFDRAPLESLRLLTGRAIKIRRFRYFNELREILRELLKATRYDIIIHSAAVSDFKVQHRVKGKLKSDKAYTLKLVPRPKIIRDIRCLCPEVKLVLFKLESRVSDEVLLRRAKKMAGAFTPFEIQRSHNKARPAKAGLFRTGFTCELVVANCLNPYRAFIINKKHVISIKTKQELAKKLIKILGTVR